ncbi:MAG: hypothetical protein J5722_00650 [Oscillospiraceae bacterium]|nr:hypothetical protein [Oscillospiraceae bacterium]
MISHRRTSPFTAFRIRAQVFAPAFPLYRIALKMSIFLMNSPDDTAAEPFDRGNPAFQRFMRCDRFISKTQYHAFPVMGNLLNIHRKHMTADHFSFDQIDLKITLGIVRCCLCIGKSVRAVFLFSSLYFLQTICKSKTEPELSGSVSLRADLTRFPNKQNFTALIAPSVSLIAPTICAA